MSALVTKRLAPLLLASACALSCGTTGDELITFPAFAAGASGAGDPFTVNGYTIQLTFAQMYIGGLYLNEAPAGPSFDSPECISTGIYAAQVPGTVQLDLLSTTPQPFSVMGSGTADLAQSLGAVAHHRRRGRPGQHRRGDPRHRRSPGHRHANLRRGAVHLRRHR